MVELRPLVFARDHYQCQAIGLMPGSCSGALAAHHRWTAVRLDTIENLVTLCHEHHQGDNGVHQRKTRAYEVGLLLRMSAKPTPADEWVPRDPSGSFNTSWTRPPEEPV